MTTTPTVSSDHLPPMNLEVGDIIEGEVVSKTDQMTSVAIEQRIVKLSNDVEVVSEVGEKILLEVKKSHGRQCRTKDCSRPKAWRRGQVY